MRLTRGTLLAQFASKTKQGRTSWKTSPEAKILGVRKGFWQTRQMRKKSQKTVPDMLELTTEVIKHISWIIQPDASRSQEAAEFPTPCRAS